MFNLIKTMKFFQVEGDNNGGSPATSNDEGKQLFISADEALQTFKNEIKTKNEEIQGLRSRILTLETTILGLENEIEIQRNRVYAQDAMMKSQSISKAQESNNKNIEDLLEEVIEISDIKI